MSGADNGAGDVVRLEAVRKVYGDGNSRVVALDGVSIGFRRGGFTAVMGPSGSGKTSLLQVAAGLDRPTSGLVVLDGVELTGLGETALARLRRERVGFVFQAFNLLPSLTVEQNVVLPMRLNGRRPDRARVAQVLDLVGLAERRHHRPGALSGGQQQRVAIARALVAQPAVLFADEPTGALDTVNTRQVLGLLEASVRSAGQTVVMVTHDPLAAASADRVVFLADGRVVDELAHPTAEAVAERMTRLGAWVDRPWPSAWSLTREAG